MKWPKYSKTKMSDISLKEQVLYFVKILIWNDKRILHQGFLQITPNSLYRTWHGIFMFIETKKCASSPSVMQFDILDFNTSHRSFFRLVDQRFSKGFQHFSLVVFKVSINLVDRLVLHHPQMALGLSDQPGIMAHNYHSPFVFIDGF